MIYISLSLSRLTLFRPFVRRCWCHNVVHSSCFRLKYPKRAWFMSHFLYWYIFMTASIWVHDESSWRRKSLNYHLFRIHARKTCETRNTFIQSPLENCKGVRIVNWLNLFMSFSASPLKSSVAYVFSRWFKSLLCIAIQSYFTSLLDILVSTAIFRSLLVLPSVTQIVATAIFLFLCAWHHFHLPIGMQITQ